MEYDRNSNGCLTLIPGLLLPIVALIAIVFGWILDFFFNLQGQSWLYFFIGTAVLLFLGAALIVRAKLPVYRNRQFFTFGLKSVPQHLQRCYRWGWAVFVFGVVLSLCLLLSRQ